MPNTTKNEKKLDKPLIKNRHFYPRSEFYARFHGTTAFAMDEPKHFGTYHRSVAARSHAEAGGRKQAQFSTPFIKKPPGKTHSFYVHTGGIHSPFNSKKYRNELTLKKQAPEGTVNVRDQLLLYKNRMAKEIVTSFEESKTNINKQKIKYTKTKYYTRPIVYTENNYPCVLVMLPVLNPSETKTAAAEYWAKHPKVFQRLLLSSFIAILNVEAIRADIPIEMVIRASFGHNLPSVCETNNSFRINVGIIPTCYAKLIGKALYKLNQAMNKITDKNSRLADFFNQAFHTQVRIYNAKKLKKAIENKDRYKKLRNTPDFKKAESSDKGFNQLYKSFQDLNKDKKRKGRAIFIPVDLKNKTVWQVIRQPSDSMGKSVLAECFRKKGTEDWFANQVMIALLDKSNTSIETAIETALVKLLKCISYGEKVTMNYKKIHKELKCEKRKFEYPTFDEIYKTDAPFSDVVKIICDALLVKKPSQALYGVLERAGTKLFSEYRGSKTVPKNDSNFGSDSDFSCDLNDDEQSTSDSDSSHDDSSDNEQSTSDSDSSHDDSSDNEQSTSDNEKSTSDSDCSNDDSSDEEKPTEAMHMSHVKLRVCSGMKAILLAQYGACSYLGAKKIKTDSKQMYYEVEDALPWVKVSDKGANVKANRGSKILHFDLNHCNANNAENNKQLAEKLKDFEPNVVILDYTSSSSLEIKEALQKCFSTKNVNLVLLADSGLKNNQGGLDFNPCGEVRVCARDRKTKLVVAERMKSELSEEDKLCQKAHEMARVCKRRGMKLSLNGLFKTNKSRFKIVEENSEISAAVSSKKR